MYGFIQSTMSFRLFSDQPSALSHDHVYRVPHSAPPRSAPSTCAVRRADDTMARPHAMYDVLVGGSLVGTVVGIPHNEYTRPCPVF